MFEIQKDKMDDDGFSNFLKILDLVIGI